MRTKILLGNEQSTTLYATTLPPCHLTALYFFYLYCMHYMILMSKKMTSQKKLGEIKSVPYNKPQLLRPVLLQDYFGTGLRYYFVAGAEIVPQKGVCNRNKTSA